LSFPKWRNRSLTLREIEHAFGCSKDPNKKQSSDHCESELSHCCSLRTMCTSAPSFSHLSLTHSLLCSHETCKSSTHEELEGFLSSGSIDEKATKGTVGVQGVTDHRESTLDSFQWGDSVKSGGTVNHSRSGHCNGGKGEPATRTTKSPGEALKVLKARRDRKLLLHGSSCSSEISCPF
jgi:hypothetical protein